MIYTVTFNPSLDYLVTVDNFRLGKTNRTVKESMVAGGKGFNVSSVLNNLGIKSTALGFYAGFTGEEIVKRIEALGIEADMIRLEEGMSRINVKMLNADGTEINAMGPDIPKEKQEELMEKLDRLQAGDILVLAGSIPATMPDDTYQKILERLLERGIRSVVDATGKLLMKVLPYHPFLIKPNKQELTEMFGVEIESEEDIVLYAKKLREMGAMNVLVSLGAQGAVLITEKDEVFSAPAPDGKVVNSVGAGDSMVAGFLAGYLESSSFEKALRLGLAAGSASAFSEQLATKEEILRVYGG